MDTFTSTNSSSKIETEQWSGNPMALVEYDAKSLMKGPLFGDDLCRFGQAYFHDANPWKPRKDPTTSREGLRRREPI